MDYIGLFPFWKIVFDKIIANECCLVHAPQHYGKNNFIRSIMDNSQIINEFNCFRINSEYIDSKDDTYSLIWKSIIKRKFVNSRKSVKNKFSFKDALTNSIISQDTKKMLFIFPSASKSSVTQQYELISSFYDILISLPIEYRNKLVLLVLDDYILYYYEDFASQKISKWDYFERLYYRNFKLDEVESFISSLKIFKNFINLPSFIFHTTEGHPGLIKEILNFLIEQEFSEYLPEKHNRFITEALKKNVIMEELRRSIEEDAYGLCTRALEYNKGKPLHDHSSPTVQVLIHLGIIHKVDSSNCKLCDGVIKDTIIELKKANERDEPLGSVVPYFGPKKYEVGRLEPNDDEIVILHISDIHVGDSFPFQLPNRDAGNLYKSSIDQLLVADLKKQELFKKVDGVLISGDFTQKGSMDEFMRARDLILKLMTTLEVDLSRIAFVAGNHDVDWTPAPLLAKDANTGISREFYDLFRELLGKPKDKIVDLVKIESKSKSKLLRVLCMDSNLIESKQTAGLGFIGPEVFLEAENLLSIEKEKGEEYSNIIDAVLTHHHVFPSTSVPPDSALNRKISVLVNSYELLNFANTNNIGLIIHGHEHQPSISVSNRWPYDDDKFTPITTICAGSLSAAEPELIPFSKNHYYIIIIREKDIIIRSRALRKGGTAFFAHSDIQISMT